MGLEYPSHARFLQNGGLRSSLEDQDKSKLTGKLQFHLPIPDIHLYVHQFYIHLPKDLIQKQYWL